MTYQIENQRKDPVRTNGGIELSSSTRLDILPERILHQFKRIACGEAVEIPGVSYILDVVGKAHDEGCRIVARHRFFDDDLVEGVRDLADFHRGQWRIQKSFSVSSHKEVERDVMLIIREVFVCKEFIADLSDGGRCFSWGSMVFSARDDNDRKYGCDEDGCSFHSVKLGRNELFGGVVFPTVGLGVLTGIFSFSHLNILYF
jgi:hypothetical protein